MMSLRIRLGNKDVEVLFEEFTQPRPNPDDGHIEIHLPTGTIVKANVAADNIKMHEDWSVVPNRYVLEVGGLHGDAFEVVQEGDKED